MPVMTKNDRLDLCLERLSLTAGKCPPEIQEAATSLISAVNYGDKPLLDSHLNSFYDALRAGITKMAQHQLGALGHFREAWREILEEAKLARIEDYDSLGSQLQDCFDETLSNMASLRDGCIRGMRQAGYPIELEADLEREVTELKAFKNHIFDQWPWSSRPMPPLGFLRIQEAKKASARGEGENIDDLLRRL